jgi:uncharacterized protein (TIGR03790 family)
MRWCWLAAAVGPELGLLLAQGPDNLLLVVNQNSNASREVAEYYARRRAVPQSNLCPIRAPVVEQVPRSTYERQIEAVIGRCLDARAKSQPPITMIATTLGVPLTIQQAPGGQEGPESTIASVDSELAALHVRRQGRKVPLEGPAPNPFFGKVYAPFDQRAFPMYLVARLAAYDVASAKRMIDRALAASNHGRFVVDLREGPMADMADEWLVSAVAALPRSRVTVESTTAVLQGAKDVVAYASWGSNDKNRKNRWSGFEFRPGSIVTEFVSSNMRTLARPPAAWTFGTWEDHSTHFARSPQSVSADYIEEGATAVTGHVAEPYLTHAPRPDHLFPAYYSGRTLVESYYVSLPSLSWMNVLLGDPLCRLGPPQ